MTDLARQTPKQRENYSYLMDVVNRLEWDLHNTIEMTSHIPEEWHEIAARRPARPRLKVNLALEADVVRFFKSMGEGYGARINDVLKSYMYARLAGVIKGAETTNHFRKRTEVHSGPKPRFGDIARMAGDDWQDDAAEPTKELRKARFVEALQQKFAEEGVPEDGVPGIRVR